MSGSVVQGIGDRGVAPRPANDAAHLSGLPVGDWLDAPLADLLHETMLALARTEVAQGEAPSAPVKAAASPHLKSDSETSLAFRALRKLPHTVADAPPPTIPPGAPDRWPPAGAIHEPQDRGDFGSSLSKTSHATDAGVSGQPLLHKPVPVDTVRSIASRVEKMPAEGLAPGPMSVEVAAQPTRLDDVESIWTDIRALLDHLDSGSSLESLDRRMQELASTVDRQVGRSSSALEEHPLPPNGTPASRVTGPVGDEWAVDERVFPDLDRTGQGLVAPDGAQRLEEMMGGLAKRLEDFGPMSDLDDPTALHARIEWLSQRLERSEASLSSLDTIEHSLRDLVSQLENVRRASIEVAESAARIVAHETLRTIEQSAHVLASDPRPDRIEKIAHDVEELRHRHEASERRTQAALAGLHEAVERLVDHWENPLARDPVKGLDVVAAPEMDSLDRRGKAPVVALEFDRRQVKPRSLWSASDPKALPGSIELDVTSGERCLPRSDVGSVAPPEDPFDTASAPAIPGAGGGLPSFIASARRVIQASGSSATSGRDPVRPPAGPGASTSRFLSSVWARLERARTSGDPRRQPLMLTFAGLALAIGVFAIAQTEFGALSSSLVVAADVVPSEGLSASDVKPSPGAADASNVTGSIAPIEAATAAMTPKAEVDTSAPVPVQKDAAPRPDPVPGEVVAGLGGLSDGLKAKAFAGDASAEYEVGLRFAQGRTVARDPSTAATWFEKAATHGSAPAQYRLGLAFEKGIGKPHDASLAMSWYTRASKAGNVRAIHNLAVMTAEGAVGKPDYVKAATLFEKAAGFGVKDSQFNLGMLYARGLGVAQNRGRSYTWFALAAAQGDDDAARKRDELAARLEPQVLRAAKAAVESFRAAPLIQAANEVATPPGGWDASSAPAPSDLSGHTSGPLKSSMLGSTDPG